MCVCVCVCVLWWGELTDGIDDAAVAIASAIQGSQVGDGLLGQLVLSDQSILPFTFYNYNCQ